MPPEQSPVHARCATAYPPLSLEQQLRKKRQHSAESTPKVSPTSPQLSLAPPQAGKSLSLGASCAEPARSRPAGGLTFQGAADCVAYKAGLTHGLVVLDCSTDGTSCQFDALAAAAAQQGLKPDTPTDLRATIHDFCLRNLDEPWDVHVARGGDPCNTVYTVRRMLEQEGGAMAAEEEEAVPSSSSAQKKKQKKQKAKRM